MRAWIVALALAAAVARPCVADEMADAKIEVRADNLKIESGDRRATFTGNVRAVYRGMSFRCQRMVVTYSEDGDVLSLFAEGGVAVSRADGTATAKTARFDLGRGLLVLEGNPVLTKGENKLAGRSIEVDLNGGEIEVKGATGTFVFRKGGGR